MNDLHFMPHQEEALNRTEQFNRCAYYLDMGLGKTFVGAEKMYLLNNSVKGDKVDLIVDGVEVMKVISKEEFGEGVKRLAQADNPKPENPIDGAMNPPEKGRRTRRSAAQAQPDNADTTADETQAVDEQPTVRTRRVRKTR